MIFSTPYQENRFKTPPEVNSGETLVETAGYISAQKRIESLILAGQRLVDYRKSQFDFPDGEIDEDFTDPTRIANFDLADATQLQMQTEVSLKASQTAQEAQKSVQTAQEAQKSVQTAQEAQKSVQTAQEGVKPPEYLYDPITGQKL